MLKSEKELLFISDVAKLADVSTASIYEAIESDNIDLTNIYSIRSYVLRVYQKKQEQDDEDINEIKKQIKLTELELKRFDLSKKKKEVIRKNAVSSLIKKLFSTVKPALTAPPRSVILEIIDTLENKCKGMELKQRESLVMNTLRSSMHAELVKISKQIEKVLKSNLSEDTINEVMGN